MKMSFLGKINEEVCCNFSKQLHVIIFPKRFTTYLRYGDDSKYGEQNWPKISHEYDLFEYELCDLIFYRRYSCESTNI